MIAYFPAHYLIITNFPSYLEMNIYEVISTIMMKLVSVFDKLLQQIKRDNFKINQFIVD